MAKMALNGYEIGIQRKIKPADHIQSMADKIQDTVVTKHPLNADGLSSGENSRDSTLKRPLNINFEKGYKTQDSIQSLGDKIKETIINNHPVTVNFTNNNVPVPPPIPKSPIPTFNVHSTPVASQNITNNKKQTEVVPKNLNNIFVSDTHNSCNNEKSHNGSGFLSNEDLNKDRTDSNTLSNTLRKKTGFDKTSFLNGMNSSYNDIYKPEIKLDSNTLNKKKIFENRDVINGSNNYGYIDKINKVQDKSNVTNFNISVKSNSPEKTIDESNSKMINDEDHNQKPSLPNNLYDNTLYSYKAVKNDNNVTINSNDNLSNQTGHHKEPEFTNGDEKQDENESETVVRRRQKKNTRNDDGRRDSHIIARPMSTMTSADVADGLYPVCHKCDKAITR